MKRIAVKIGSNVLTRTDGKVDVTRLSAIVDQVAWLRQHDYEVILVSSGAVACGRGELTTDRRLSSVEQRQLFSAMGQVKLIGLYYDLFREHGIHVGQVLTMKESFATREEYLNQRACISVMLESGVVPIVNENDTVSVTELMFTDNDELSGLIASMMNCSELIILTNVDGIYDGDPTDPDSKVLPVVDSRHSLNGCIQEAKSGFGRGGMMTKARIAGKVAEEGIRVVIANGCTDGILIGLAESPESTLHTEFCPSETVQSPVKKWIAHSDGFAKGKVCVNAKAEQTLRSPKAASLLLVGVTSVEGDFEEGDIISVTNASGEVIAVGRSSYSAAEARRSIGMHGLRPLIHYDYMCMEQI